MKSVALSGSKRAERGSSNANNLRKEEQIPCVIYGGRENIHFTVNEIQLGKIINTAQVYFIELDIDGVKIKAIIKALQFHPVTDRVLHADFLEVFEDKPVMVRIPVIFVGRSKGIANGGTLRTALNRLRVKGLPSAIPENIEIDITELLIGQSIKVGELDFEGLTFMGADNAVVVAVKMSRAIIEDEEEEEVDLEAMTDEERAEYEKANPEAATEDGDKPEGEAKKEDAASAE